MNAHGQMQRHPSYHHRRQLSDISHNGSANMQSPNGNGAMPMPVGGGMQRPPPYQTTPADMSMLSAARSPPKNKSESDTGAGSGGGKKGRSGLSKRADTSHVPCKFYLQGQCQAGRMCPFSHDLESTTRPAPCKYFAKGHCKFGTKCALLHVTPDGVVINNKRYSQAAPYPQGPPPGAYGQAPPGLLSMQALEQRPNGEMLPEDVAQYQYAARNGYDMPQFDYTSASPKFGSPPQHDRFGYGSSPHQKGLSVLDAPLPNSFDSNGVSMAARLGPFAASVPSRFGIESPPSSLPRKSQLGNTALQDLHHSAFGDRGNLDSVLAGSSPPSGGDEPLSFPKRPLHSNRLRTTSRPMISSSVGTALPTKSFEYSDDEDDGETDTDREEDLLPASLHDLIPGSRSRRESRQADNPASFLAAQRRTLSNTATPGDSKSGSPSFSSSPSRYTSVFAPQRSNSSDFVGSPLRNSGFGALPGPSQPQRPSLAPDALNTTVGSPPRQASMSMLTQELQRTNLNAARAASSSAVPAQGGGSFGTTSGLTSAAAPGAPRNPTSTSSKRLSIDRASSGINIGRERIDEEQELFDMDEISGRSDGAGLGVIGSPRGAK